MTVERAIRRSGPLLASVLIGVAALVEVAPSKACSCDDPSPNELLVGDGPIAANAGVPWWFSSQTSEPPESLVTLQRIEETARVSVAATLERFQGVYVIRPEGGWSAGERYRISVDAGRQPGTREQPIVSVEIEVTPALEATKPLEMVMSTVERRQLALSSTGGSCSAEFDAAVVELSAGAPVDMPSFPVDILHFTTYVDGALWQPSSSLCDSIWPRAFVACWLGS